MSVLLLRADCRGPDPAGRAISVVCTCAQLPGIDRLFASRTANVSVFPRRTNNGTPDVRACPSKPSMRVTSSFPKCPASATSFAVSTNPGGAKSTGSAAGMLSAMVRPSWRTTFACSHTPLTALLSPPCRLASRANAPNLRERARNKTTPNTRMILSLSTSQKAVTVPLRVMDIKQHYINTSHLDSGIPSVDTPNPHACLRQKELS